MKKYRHKAKHRKQTSRVWLWILFMMLILVTLVGWRLIRTKSAGWWGYGPFRMVEIRIPATGQKEFVLWELSAEQSSLHKLELPHNLVVPAVGFPGSYWLSGLYELSVQESGDAQLVLDSLQAQLGIYIHRVKVTHELSREIRADRWWFMQQLLGEFFRGGMSYKELELAAKTISVLGGQDILTWSLGDIGVMSEVVEIDGSEYYELSTEQFDDWYERQIPVPSLALRNLSVYVENATQKPGLANGWGRILRHQGFGWRGVGDGVVTGAGTRVLISDTLFPPDHFESFMESLFARVEKGDTSQWRSEVVVHLEN